MLDCVEAEQFVEGLFSGRTCPCLAACSRENGEEVEAVVKLLEGCKGNLRALATEAIAAMLAADLKLPVPEPFIVNVSQTFAESITDQKIRLLAEKSVGLNFGSCRLPAGYSTWINGVSVNEKMMPFLAEILAFDIMIANDDRRPQKPNCLTNGKEVAIIDHEASLMMDQLLFWKAPWESQALPDIKLAAERHLFYNTLNGTAINLERLVEAFSAISDARLYEYKEALPAQWRQNNEAVDRILTYIGQARDHAADAARLITGVLQ